MTLNTALTIARKVLYNIDVSSKEKYDAYIVLAKWHKALCNIEHVVNPK